MKFGFDTRLRERLTLAFEAYLDEKYPGHERHELVSWAELLGEDGSPAHRGFVCSCGETMVLTWHEMIAVDAVPLH